MTSTQLRIDDQENLDESESAEQEMQHEQQAVTHDSNNEPSSGTSSTQTTELNSAPVPQLSSASLPAPLSSQLSSTSELSALSEPSLHASRNMIDDLPTSGDCSDSSLSLPYCPETPALGSVPIPAQDQSHSTVRGQASRTLIGCNADSVRYAIKCRYRTDELDCCADAR